MRRPASPPTPIPFDGAQDRLPPRAGGWQHATGLRRTRTVGDGTTQAQYTLDLGSYGDLISQRRSSTSRWYHFDALGSTDRLTGADGSATDTYIYKAFGPIAASTGSTTNPFRYVGKLGYYDQGTGPLYVRARWLRPTTGSWLSVDPVAHEPRYAYVRGRPIRSVDASGKQSLADCFAQCNAANQAVDGDLDIGCYDRCYDLWQETLTLGQKAAHCMLHAIGWKETSPDRDDYRIGTVRFEGRPVFGEDRWVPGPISCLQDRFFKKGSREAWCSMLVWHCFEQAGAPPELFPPDSPLYPPPRWGGSGRKPPSYAAAMAWCRWARAVSDAAMGLGLGSCIHCSSSCEGYQDPDYEPQPGDIWVHGDCIDEAKHAGMVVARWLMLGNTECRGVWTVDGNAHINACTCRVQLDRPYVDGVGFRYRADWFDYGNAGEDSGTPPEGTKRCYINVDRCLELIHELTDETTIEPGLPVV